MEETNIENLIVEIAQKTNKDKEDIRKMVNTKTEKYSGLLTEEAAIDLVKKELGILKEQNERLKISELSEGKKGIEIEGKIELLYPTKEFEKNGKKGKLQNFIISDNTGEIRGTLWNDQIEENKIKQGNEVIITNLIVTSYNDKKQITLGFGGKVKTIKENETEYKKSTELKAGMSNINIFGKIIRKFPCKEFENSERKGRVCSFQLGDESAIIKASAWNDKATILENFLEGDTIEITNAYTKEGKFGTELHLGYTSEIKKSEKEINSITQTDNNKYLEKKLNQINQGDNVLVEGKIIKISDGKLSYLICEKCNKKATKTENGVFCEKCGEVSGKQNPVLSAVINDDTNETQITMFGNIVLEFIENTEEEFSKDIENKSTQEILEKISENKINKTVKIKGYVKENQFLGTNEIIVKEILKN
ncbi:MAG TPA: OB-fold nucleic acid binding domain-containing protein [archaeon]|nr:OB-fold nucleic acid binding domain-containing protein [archaeon]